MYSNSYTPSGQSRVHRVAQLRADGVHCRESAGTGPVNLKVVLDERALAGHRGLINIHISLPHPLFGMTDEVGLLKIPATYDVLILIDC